MKKLTAVAAILAFGLAANAYDLTGRFEVRQAQTANSMCGGNSTTCSTKSVLDVGFGATTTVWNFGPGWDLYTGVMFRERTAMIQVFGNYSADFWHMDIPVAAQYSMESWAFRAGWDLGVKLGSTYNNLSSGSYNDTALYTPFELGVDYKINSVHRVTVAYEMATNNLANANFTGGTAAAISYVATVGYGYNF